MVEVLEGKTNFSINDLPIEVLATKSSVIVVVPLMFTGVNIPVPIFIVWPTPVVVPVPIFIKPFLAVFTPISILADDPVWLFPIIKELLTLVDCMLGVFITEFINKLSILLMFEFTLFVNLLLDVL